MDKIRRDKRKEVQTRLNFGENNKRTRRERENSLNSRPKNSPTRVYPERSRTRGRERRDDRNVFSRLSHRRKSVHERLSNTYSLSTTKSGPSRTDSRDPSHSRGHHPRRERPRIEERSRSAEESYGDTYSQETKTKYRDRSRDGDQFRSVKRRRESESPSSRGSESSTSHFTASNNEAEYEALIAGLRIAAQMGVRNVQVSVDSKLVANQVLGTYVAKEENMVKYLEKVKSLVSGFAKFSISQVPRSKNKKADALSKIASTSFAHLSKQVLVEILKEKSIQEEEVATVIEEEETTWMTPITEYLKDGTLPGERKEASKLRIKARQYELLEGVLYKRSFLKPWLRCVGPLQAKYVIREIHEGSCSMHAGPRSVVAKAMRLGYYWPTMHRDAREMIRTCNDCQIHRPVPRNPQHKLTPITAPWPFYKWGIDIAGPFPEGPGKVKFLIVAMDYFTKWIEAKAVATITGNQCFASVKHPQANGLVERANRNLGEGIKARLGEGNKNWVEELPHVLWAHRTMIKSSHGDTPFSLTYGTEAVIPAEIEMPTYRTTVVDAVHNDEELRLNLDLLEEKREHANAQQSVKPRLKEK
ncbi:reverse transcriptase domain-containing protein [Tanacetum coccineum]